MTEQFLPDIPRLYTALAEWLGCLVYILLMRKRFKGYRLVALLAAGLALQCVINVAAGSMHPIFWLGWMLLAFAGMYALIFLCLTVNIRGALFYTVRAFIAAEFAASFEWQIYCYFHTPNNADQFWSIIYLFVLYALVFTVLLFIEKRHVLSGSSLDISIKELFSSTLICISIFIMSNISFVSQNTPFSSGSIREVFYIRTLVDFAGLVMLYAQLEIRRETELRRELETMDNLLHKQYNQYRISKENDELISRRYHDLKHQISIIRAESDPEKREEYLRDIDAVIKEYEAENCTGNSVLDTILNGKSIQCANHDIQMTCVADGTILDFIGVMDICTIFGNALDNAIECVEKLDDPEQRIISVIVTAQNEFAILRFENCCDPSALVMDTDMPVTTKADAAHHGYGLKSIRAAVEKYDGCITINAQNNWFCLNILLPLTKR